MSDPFGGGGGGGFGPPNQGGGGGFGSPPPGGGGFGQPPGGPPPQGGGGFGQPPGGPPPQGGGFNPPPGGGGFGAPATQSVQIDEKPALMLGFATAFLCCPLGGIAALLLAQSAKTAAVNGDAEGAKTKLRISMAISGVSVLLALTGLCLYLGLMVVANA